MRELDPTLLFLFVVVCFSVTAAQATNLKLHSSSLQASCGSQQEAVEQALMQKSGASQDVLNKVLLLAAKQQNIECIEWLLGIGANPDARSAQGWTPLLYALLYSDEALALHLIPYSDVRIYTEKGLSRKQSRLRQYTSIPRSNALFLAGLRFPGRMHVVRLKILERIDALGGDSAVLLSKMQATLAASQLSYVDADAN